ncbi:MAG TPA: glycoside hydrolase family 25 protein [Gaiellaceae bacterium]|nr:glycoside hydrolase family 25 protein [Gaiellaceae bacterium]
MRRRFSLLIASVLVLALPAAGSAYVRGIDVSHWKGMIAWAKVKRGGHRFAFAEATNGLGVDWTYGRNRAGAKAAGLGFGAFHLARPNGSTRQAVVADAVAEADLFVSVASPQTGELAPVLDLERTGGLSPASLRAWTIVWLDEVWRQVGIRPTIYASPSFWRRSMRDAGVFAATGSRLWIAHWRVKAPRVPASNWASTGWSFWQWTNCSRVPGIRGCVDGDRFRGPRIAGALMAPPPLSIQPPTITGVPQAGETLSAAPGTWQASEAPAVGYEWQRCVDTTGEVCLPIAKAITSTYVVTPADVGYTLRVVVAATSAARTAWASSTAVPVNG